MKPLAIAALALIAAAPGERVMHHATGSFAVTITPEAQAPAPAGGMPTSRMGLAKTFSGGMVGHATGTMIAVGAPGPGKVAAYVAIDQFHGSVDGKTGGFLLLHRATMSSAGPEMSVTLAPDSGTGALTGIAGTLAIEVTDGVHRYELTYSLPENS